MNLLGFKVKEFSLIHSILFSIFPGIVLYSINQSLLPIESFVLPLLLVVSFAFSLWVILRFVLKNSKKAGFIVSILFFMFLMFYHFVNVLSENEDISIKPMYLAFIFLIIFGLATYYFVKTKRKLDNATKITNGMAIALVSIVLLNIGIFQAETNPALAELGIPKEGISVSANENPPDVYYIFLDGHTNPIVAKKFLGQNDQEFVNFLTEKGFYVPSHYTHSNYMWTVFSTPSLLNMNYLQQIVPGYGESFPPEKDLYTMIDKNEVMYNFKSMGYQIINFDSGWWGTRIIDIADENLCEDRTMDYRLFTQIKDTTALAAIKTLDDFFTEQIFAKKRQHISCELAELATVRDRFEGPIFVFTHFDAPHPPWVFEANGEPVKEYISGVGTNYSENIENRTNAYFKQMKFIDNEIQKIIEKILDDTEHEKIIIIQSDHGARLEPKGSTPEEKKVILLGNFNAFYLPDDSGKFLAEHSNVNTFRIIFNTYFNGNYEILEDKVIFERIEIENWDKMINDVLKN